MGKMKKKILFLLVVLSFTFSLCGCTMESVRSTHAVWNQQGNITWKGSEYVLLVPVDQEFTPLLNMDENLYVTEEDVPTLLQYTMGTYMNKSLDEKFLVDTDYIYCRSDCYDEMVTVLEQGSEMNGYCYEYWDDNGNFQYYQLDSKQTDILNSIFDEITPVEMSYDELYESEWVYYGDVQSCSKDMLFRTFAFELWSLEDDYYIIVPDETWDQAYRYDIPAEHVEAVEEIFDKLMVSDW